MYLGPNLKFNILLAVIELYFIMNTSLCGKISDVFPKVTNFTYFISE
jgi:hypothetical protein